MRYGIVGASGTLGRVVVRHLLNCNAGNSVNALVRRPDEQLEGLARCHLATGGIFDAGGVDELARNSDVVVNLAARNPGSPDEDDANLRDFYAINALGAGVVAAASRRWRRPLIHFSSVAVYETGESGEGGLETESAVLPGDDTGARDFHDSMVGYLESRLASNPGGENVGPEVIRDFLEETESPVGAPLYALSKLVGETLVARLADLYCAIRMSDVYGPGHESRGVVTDHLNALRDDARVVVDFDFRSSACFVYIDDVCRFIADAAAKTARAERMPNVVNFCGPRLDEAGFRQSLADLAERHGVPKAVTLPDRDGPKADRRYATEVFGRCFPSFVMTAFADGLEATWRDSMR